MAARVRRQRPSWALEADPHSLNYEVTLPVRQQLFRACCASSIEHRFDCSEVPREARGDGPFGPVAPSSPAELVARLRSG